MLTPSEAKLPAPMHIRREIIYARPRRVKRLVSSKVSPTPVQRARPEDRASTGVATPQGWRSGAVSDVGVGGGDGSFHQVLGSVLCVAQCFGLMPVSGVTRPHVASLRFQWFSIPVIYAGAVILLEGFWTIFWAIILFFNGLSFGYLTAVVFYGTALANSILFFHLGWKWPALMASIRRVELSTVFYYGFPRKMYFQIKVLAFVVLVAALGEHLFSIERDIRLSYLCADNNYDRIQVYFVARHRLIFEIVPYSPFFGVSIFVADWFTTFVWNYMDLFIMMLSVLMTERLSQLNVQLDSLCDKVTSESTWRHIREDYTKITGIVSLMDENINKIVFLSFGNNLYFICIQLFNSIKPKSVEEAVYFYYSFGYLVLRSSAVCLCAANINVESKKPRKVLHSVPSPSYCIEVERFIDHVNSAEVALTGLKFFTVTRKLMLTIIGTIVTYEIVLVQLNVEDGTAAANSTVTQLGIPRHRNPLCPDRLL